MPGITIKDPIHGAIELNEFEQRIIDTRVFQRLRGIRQLATAYLVYPGANHSRFEHSLGTLHLASRIAGRIGVDNDTTLKIRLYALLHDVGHIAFSHEAEAVTSNYLGNHEAIGRSMLASGELADMLSENFRKNELADFEKSAYAKVISSDIGADRMDYLKRDSYYTGVAYGIIDEQRIMEKLYFEGSELGVEAGALEASESLLIARFMMFSTVYFHHTVRIASAMLAKSLKLALEGRSFAPQKLLESGDSETLLLLSKTKGADFYANAISGRGLYKQAFSLAPCQAKDPAKLEQELSSIAKCDIIVDAPQNVFSISGFKVKMHDGKKERIEKASELVRALSAAENSRKRALVLCPEAKREKVEKACLSFFSAETACPQS